MFSARFTGLIRFVIGILLLQAATALLTYIALTSTDVQQTLWLFAALAGALGILVALWFDSVICAVREQTLAKQHKRHSREREKLKLQAERDRARISQQRKRAFGGAGLRTGVAVGGIAGVGVALMMAQLMTLGLLTVATAGGAALGYTVRARQDKLIRARDAAQTERLLENVTRVPALERKAPRALKADQGKRRRDDEREPGADDEAIEG